MTAVVVNALRYGIPLGVQGKPRRCRVAAPRVAPVYGVDAPLTLRSLTQLATRARRLPRLRAVEGSAATGCREPSVPANLLGPIGRAEDETSPTLRSKLDPVSV